MLEPSVPADLRAREGSAALRFLMDHRAGDAIARAIGRDLPPVDWASLSRYGSERDSLGRMVMELAGAGYVPEYAYGPKGWFHLAGGGPIRVAGYGWAVTVTANDPTAQALGTDTVAVVRQDGDAGVARVRILRDTLVFDLRPIVRRYADSVPARTGLTVAPIVVEESSGRRRATLVLTSLSGELEGDSLRTGHWIGTLLLGE
jgi:hypothetical protein